MLRPQKVLIVITDDYRIFLEGLVSLLEKEPHVNVVKAVPRMEDALVVMSKQSIDIAIIDITTPSMDGVELNRLIKKKHPKVKTLVLTTLCNPGMILRLVRHDIDGYFLKNGSKTTLLEALFTLANGRKYFPRELKEKYIEMHFSDRGVDRQTTILSKREREVLQLIATEYTAPEIAEKLFISQHTVNAHRKNLITKLGVKSIAGLVKYAYQKGIVY